MSDLMNTVCWLTHSKQSGMYRQQKQILSVIVDFELENVSNVTNSCFIDVKLVTFLVGQQL